MQALFWLPVLTVIDLFQFFPKSFSGVTLFFFLINIKWNSGVFLTPNNLYLLLCLYWLTDRAEKLDKFALTELHAVGVGLPQAHAQAALRQTGTPLFYAEPWSADICCNV